VAFPVHEARRPEEASDLLTLEAACEMLGVGNQRLYLLVAQGHLHPLRHPGKPRVFYAAWEVQELLDTAHLADPIYDASSTRDPAAA
jgi:hypothetical protein